MAILTLPHTWLERRRARSQADYWIRHGFETRCSWRVEELTSVRERRLSARSLHSILAEVDGRRLPGAAPLRVAALRPQIELLEAIEARLLSDDPVSGVGMLAVNDLLTSPGSCLFAAVDDVGSELRAVLQKLEV